MFVSYSYNEAKGTMDTGYPRSIETDFPGIGDEVDAAAYRSGIHENLTHSQIHHQMSLNTFTV